MDKQKQLDDFFGLNAQSDQDNQSIKKTLLKHTQKKSRFKLVPKILSARERYTIFGFLLLFIGSVLAMPITSYIHYTTAVADTGGSFTEGFVGEPHYLNPLLAQTNDVDRDLTALVFSGLLQYSTEGTLVPDLAQSYEISSDGLNYTVYLREDATWHDGRPITADDVVFTIQTAQNDDYGSRQRINWTGVEVQKVDTHTLMFTLKNRYAQFLNNLTLQIIPQHIWQDIKPINFALSDFNVRPVGSGPYAFSKLQKDASGKIISYEFKAYENFYDQRPFIDTLRVMFFSSEDEMIDAYNRNEIDNLSLISAKNLERIRFKQRLNIHAMLMPRYFAAFYNQNQSTALSDKNVRLALAHATDRTKLIQDIFAGNAIPATSPMIGDILGFSTDIPTQTYDPELAKTILTNAGWGTPNEDGILTKGNATLSLKLTTSIWPELTSVAAFLKEEWKKVGIDVVIEVLNTSELQQVIKDRNYQILLFGEILNVDPDPFTFWHSSGKRDPGLNLALYENKAADTLLEEARQILNPADRAAKYNDFQRVVVEDMPALFLYSTHYLYGQTKSIKGFANKIIATPSARFTDIEHWYIDTRRTFQ